LLRFMHHIKVCVQMGTNTIGIKDLSVYIVVTTVQVASTSYT